MKVTLNINYLLVDNYYGGNQDWYNSYLKRLAGCGPTTAATITMYELNKINYHRYTKNEFILLMNELSDEDYNGEKFIYNDKLKYQKRGDV